MPDDRSHSGAPPQALRELVARFDPDPFDAPAGRATIRLTVRDQDAFDVHIEGERAWLEPARQNEVGDAELSADAATWRAILRNPRGGMTAYRAGRLGVRRNLHLGVGFLAATSGESEPGRLRYDTVKTRLGRMSMLEAGTGEPLVMVHGLGATKAEFLPTVAALAPAGFRTIAVDLPGFGDSDKPFPAPYDSRFFARWTVALLDALGLDRVHLLGHSMGGRVALEVGMRHPERLRSLVLITPSLAWRGAKRWAPYLRFVRPELGMLQVAPRGVVEGVVRRLIAGSDDAWVAAGIDEFLRSYLTPRGRVAFYAAARQIYLDEGEGDDGFWHRLEQLSPRSMFIWGRRDQLVPIGFERHVRQAVPGARHIEVDSGHVPQLECPMEVHPAIERFLRGVAAADGARVPAGSTSVRRARAANG